MHGGMMFFPWGGGFAGFWLLIPVALFLAMWLLRRVPSAGSRAERKRTSPRKMPIQDQVIRLAYRQDGLLTVTDVVAETGLSFKKAEEALNAMVDHARVNMRIDESGIIVYEFTEILAKNRIDAKHPPGGL